MGETASNGQEQDLSLQETVSRKGAAPLPLQERSSLRQGTKVLSAAEKSNSSSWALEHKKGQKPLTPQKMLSEMCPLSHSPAFPFEFWVLSH